jgi:hypothetical protein
MDREDRRDDPEPSAEPNVVALTPEEERNLRAHLEAVAARFGDENMARLAWGDR